MPRPSDRSTSTLPEEDYEAGDGKRRGRLRMSMYGTRDAALNWATEYTQTLLDDGFLQGKSNPCLFRHPTTDVAVMVHGDDFVAVSTGKHLVATREVHEDKHKLKVELLGKEEECVKEVRILNKVVRYTSAGIELEADPRHAEIVVKDLGLQDAKPRRVPGAKPVKCKADRSKDETREVMILNEGDNACKVVFNPGEKNNGDDDLDAAEEENPEMKKTVEEDHDLDAAEAKKFRAIVARLNYLAVDRIDIQYAVKESARRMSQPRSSDWKAVQKIGRYLVGKPRLVMKFPWQSEVSTVTTYTDSDWAGCPITARSTSGGIVSIGGHMIK